MARAIPSKAQQGQNIITWHTVRYSIAGFTGFSKPVRFLSSSKIIKRFNKI